MSFRGIRRVPNAVTLLRTFVAGLCCALCLPGYGQTRYTITDLGTLPPHTYPYATESIAYGVNNANQAVGSAPDNRNQQRAVLWSAATGFQDLGSFRLGEPSFSEARSINDVGVVAGTSWSDLGPANSANQRAFTWSPGTGMAMLETVGERETRGFAINAAGQVAGSISVDNFRFHATLWTDGKLRDLGVFDGGSSSYAMGINNHGHVVGTGNLSNDREAAFLWTPEEGLIALPGLSDSGSTPYAINDSGHIVGTSGLRVNGQPANYACLWVNRTVQSLGALDGDSHSYARDINNMDQIVGYSSGNRTPNELAVIWINNAPVDLNTLVVNGEGWKLRLATSINDRGYIVGWGEINGQAHGFLLSPQYATPPFQSDDIKLRAYDDPTQPLGREVDGIVCDNLAIMDDDPSYRGRRNRLQLRLPPPFNDGETQIYGVPIEGGRILSDADGQTYYYPPLEYNEIQSPGNGTQDITRRATRSVNVWLRLVHNGQVYAITKQIVLARPPTILVHGINSAPANWAKFRKRIQIDKNIRTALVPVNHSGVESGNGPVETGAALLRTDIRTVLECMRDGKAILDGAVGEDLSSGVFTDCMGKRLAIRRVDIVAWSYGGVITRWYLASTGIPPDGWPWYARGKYNTGLPVITYGSDIRKVITLGSIWRGVPLCNYLNECLFPGNRSEKLGDAPLYTGNTVGQFVGALPIPVEVPSIEVLAVDSKWMRHLLYGTQNVLTDTLARPFNPEVAYGSVAGDDQNYPVKPTWSRLIRFNLYGDIDFLQQPSWFPYLALEQIPSGKPGTAFTGRAYSDGIVPIWSAAIPGSYKIAATTHDRYPEDPDTAEYVVQWLNHAKLPSGQELNRIWNSNVESVIRTHGGQKAWTFDIGAMAPYPQKDLYVQQSGIGRLNGQVWGSARPVLSARLRSTLLRRDGNDVIAEIEVVNLRPLLAVGVYCSDAILTSANGAVFTPTKTSLPLDVGYVGATMPQKIELRFAGSVAPPKSKIWVRVRLTWPGEPEFKKDLPAIMP